VPKPDASASAVIVSGGKQYRVVPGDRILVDRLAAAPGESIKLGRVLLFDNGTDIKVGKPGIDGIDVDARVIDHRRGPRIESIRYKSKKRVRVHQGGRAHLTALEIVAVGGVGLDVDEQAKEEKEEKVVRKPAKARGGAKAARPSSAPARKRAAATKAQASGEATTSEVAEAPADEPATKPAKKTPRSRAKKDGD